MGKKRYIPAQIIGKLWESEVLLTALYQHPKLKKLVVEMLIISAI